MRNTKNILNFSLVKKTKGKAKTELLFDSNPDQGFLDDHYVTSTVKKFNSLNQETCVCLQDIYNLRNDLEFLSKPSQKQHEIDPDDYLICAQDLICQIESHKSKVKQYYSDAQECIEFLSLLSKENNLSDQEIIKVQNITYFLKATLTTTETSILKMFLTT